MKKLVAFFIFILVTSVSASAESFNLSTNMDMQDRMNKVGFRILNSNRIENRVCFKYIQKPDDYSVATDIRYMYFKRIVYITSSQAAYIGDDNELAAILSRRIAQAVDSYDGIFRGYGSILDYWVKPQKYNNKSDKIAVDYMANAGYNPIALIVWLSKAEPQRRYDCLDSYSLASRRMANIYEYIYNKYPAFLADNHYSDDIYYQNFLLTSRKNRSMLQTKIENKSTKKIRYK